MNVLTGWSGFRGRRRRAAAVREALFLYTAPVVGAYWFFSAVWILYDRGWLFDSVSGAQCAALIASGALLLVCAVGTFRFYLRFRPGRRWFVRLVPVIAPAVALLAEPVVPLGDWNPVIWGILAWLIAFGWLLPLGAVTWRTLFSTLAAAGAETAGVFAFYAYWWSSEWSVFSILGAERNAFPEIQWLITSVILLALAYGIRAAVFAGWGRLPFRGVFDRATLGLLISVAVLFLAFQALAAAADRRVAEARDALERRFGLPPVAASLYGLYFRGETPDGVFYEELERELDAGWERWPREGRWSEWRWQSSNRFFELSDAEAAECAALLEKADFSALDRLTDREFPKPLLHFPRYGLVWESRLYHNQLRALAQNGLQRGGVDLRNGGMEEALRQERRLYRIGKFLRGETDPIGVIVGIATEHLRLDLWELMLESGRLPDAGLEAFAAELAELERAYPDRVDRFLFWETVMEDDLFEALLRDRMPPEAEVPRGLFPAARFLIPQLRLTVRWNQAEILERRAAFDNTRDFQSDPCETFRNACSFSWAMDLRKRFRVLIARFRAERVLIAAELHFRRTGTYPERSPLPLPDPFTGRPLRYRRGDCPVWIFRFRREPDTGCGGSTSWKWVVRNELREFPAVRVWSVGPSGCDDDEPRPAGRDSRMPGAVRRLPVPAGVGAGGAELYPPALVVSAPRPGPDAGAFLCVRTSRRTVADGRLE